MTQIHYRARWTQRGGVILINHDGRITVRRFKLRDRPTFVGQVRPPKTTPAPRAAPTFTRRSRPRRP